MTILPPRLSRSGIPLYIQVGTVMRQRIVEGVWGDGARIPPLRELEEEFAVARVTIRQAIELMRQEGLLRTQRGMGTFVSGKPVRSHPVAMDHRLETILTPFDKNDIHNIEYTEFPDLPHLGEGEGSLSPDGYVLLQFIQHHDDIPCSVVKHYISRNIAAEDRHKLQCRKNLPWALPDGDERIVHAYQTLTIGVADLEIAALLGVGLSEPTAYCRIVLVDGSGAALYVTEINHHKDYFIQRIDLMGQTSFL